MAELANRRIKEEASGADLLSPVFGSFMACRLKLSLVFQFLEGDAGTKAKTQGKASEFVLVSVCVCVCLCGDSVRLLACLQVCGGMPI